MENNNYQEKVIVVKMLEDADMIYDIYRNYTMNQGFSFTGLTRATNVDDAIIVKCKGRSDCVSPQYNIPYHTIEEYVAFIQKHKISKAVIIYDDISFINECPSLKYLQIIPPDQVVPPFDFSPLYKLPEIKWLDCVTMHGDREQYVSEIDYSKIHGLEDVGITAKGHLNYSQLPMVKTIGISGYKKRDLQDLFCSKELDTLSMIQCSMSSLDGIETSEKMQCLYLYYNRSLKDIHALSKVKGTLKALRIENCPKIVDFSVLKELENLELLELSGKNSLPSLDFIKSMPRLKTFNFSMDVLDGDLTPCLDLSWAYSARNRKHFNLKNKDLPKVKSNFVKGNESIEEWRRLD